MPNINLNSPRDAKLVWLGLVQGATLYALYKTHKALLWPSDWAPVFNAVLLVVLLLPFIVYWAHAILSRSALLRLLVALGVLTLALGAYQAATLFPSTDLKKPQLVDFPVFFGIALLGFMLVPLISAWGKQRRPELALGRWDYALLFEHAWRNAVITVQAGVLTGLLWAVLQLGAQLFHLIGIDWPRDTLEEAWFWIPVTTLSIALGMRAGLKRAAFVVTLRNHWLTLTAWLLPLVALIGSVFVLTSMGGVDKLFEGGLSAFYLLWFAAFWVKFYNSAFQDGQNAPPFPVWLQKILPFAALALLAIIGLAAWALLLRVNQHGLTPDRVWGLLVVAVASCYGIGYAFSLFKKTQWMGSITHANVLAALIMCTGIVLLLSPILDARRLSTNSQISRLNAGKVKLANFDTHALTQQGRFGHDALQNLSQQKNADGSISPLAVRANEAMESARQNIAFAWGNKPDEAPTTDLRGRLDVYPKGTPLPEDFVAFLTTDIRSWESWMRRDSCLNQANKNLRCSLLEMDLNRDGQSEFILWKARRDSDPYVYSKIANQWKRVGNLSPVSWMDNNASDIPTKLATESVMTSPPVWNELNIGKSRYVMREKDDDCDKTPFC